MKHYANDKTEYQPARYAGSAKKPPRQDQAKTAVFQKPKKSAAPEEKDPMASSEKLYLDTTPPKGKGAGRLMPAIVFVVFILGMAIWFIFNPKLEFSTSEKRPLQKFPNTSLENIVSGEFGSEFESYFADHFPARNLWVGFNAYYQLNTGNNGASGIYRCKDGYLINKPVADNQILNKNIGIVTDFKQKVGSTPVTMMLVPSTGYVCGDVLPLIHDAYRDDAYMDEASQLLSAGGVDFIDLREPFKNAYRDGKQLYYKTDHHWTTEGAYLGYTALCEKLGTAAAPRSTFMVERYNGFYGTTYSSSGFWLTDPDKIEVWNNPKNSADNIRVRITESGASKDYDSVFFYDHLKEDDKYPVFIDGNHALTEITNKNAKGGTLLVIKDSFSHCMAPFLAENYSKVILVDMRYYKQPVSEIAAVEKPEQILVLYGIDNLAADTDIPWLE